jgi:bacterioferritin
MQQEESEFAINLETIRKHAREEIRNGAVTREYKSSVESVCKLLNAALATEMVCVLRYKEHHHAATGMDSPSIAEEFLEHALNEQEHADRIANRIAQLGGDPELAPQDFIKKSHTDFVKGESLTQMIEENLVAERIVIETYNQMIRYIGEKDPTTRRLLEDILADEEEHANELRDILGRLVK